MLLQRRIEGQRRELARSCRGPLALLPVIVLAMYLPVLVANYGFADDYLFLYDLKRGGNHVASVNLSNGRPLTYVADLLGFGQVPDVDSLRWLRLVGVLGIASVSAVVLMALVVSGRPRWVAFWASVALAALPVFHVVAGWATLFVVPVAMLLAMSAAWVTHQRALRGAVTLGSTLGAAAAMAAALLIYQPAAMAYWLVLAIFVTGLGPLRRVDRAVLVAHLVPLALAAVPAALAWWIGRADQSVPGRSSLATNPWTLFLWFGGRVLPRAVAPFSLDPAAVTALGFAGVGLAGLWLAGRDPGRVVLQLSLLPLAYLPTLVVGGDIAPTTRTLVALEPVALILLLHAGEGFAVALSGAALLGRALPRLAVAAPVFLAAQATLVTQVFIARPQAIEWRAAVNAMRALPPDDLIAVAPATLDASPAGSRLFDELGMPSTFYDWNLRPVVGLAHMQATGEWPVGIEEVDHGTAGSVDFDRLLRAAR